MTRACKLEFYVPAGHADRVKKALFDAGAGRLGLYGECCWQTAGRGQFRPLEGSDPFIGAAGSTETVDELKIEMIVLPECADACVAALLASHPYETPAWQMWEVRIG